jgi:hypothetical protein
VHEAGEPVDVGEDERRPLVGGEAAGEADRQGLGVEGVLQLLEGRRRLAVAGELGDQPLAREDGELALLVEVRLPQLPVRNPPDAFPEPLGVRLAVQVVEVRVEEAPYGSRSGRPTRVRCVDAVRDAVDRPPAESAAGCRWRSPRGAGDAFAPWPGAG